MEHIAIEVAGMGGSSVQPAIPHNVKGELPGPGTAIGRDNVEVFIFRYS